MEEQEQAQSVPKEDRNRNVTAVHRHESRHWYWRLRTSMASIHDLLHPPVLLYYLHCKELIKILFHYKNTLAFPTA